VLIGAIIIGAAEHVGAIRGLIQTRHSLGAWKETLIKDPGQLMNALVNVTHKPG